MAKHKIPQAHRLAELMCYSALAVFFSVGVVIVIERIRGYSVYLPSAPANVVLPVEISPAGTTNQKSF